MDQKEINSNAYIKAEIPLIEKIIRDETWYEGERRGCKVEPDDDIVIRRVCSIIRDCDHALKEQALRSMKN